MDLVVKTLEQGFIFGIMVLGVYITYRILDFPDLTVDGSFPLGGAIVGAALSRGLSPIIAVLLAIIGGLAAGLITGVLHVKLKITNLLAGILTMIALYSINLRIMGKSNIPLFNTKSIFGVNFPLVMQLFIIVFTIKLALDLFLKTKFGFVLRATGDNPQMITNLGLDIGKVKIIGVMLSNALVALAGGLVAQYQGFADITMGTGTIIMGLASIIIGEALFKKVNFISVTLSAIVGSIVYKLSIALALRAGLQPSDLKLVTSLIVIAALGVTGHRFSLEWFTASKKGGTHHA